MLGWRALQGDRRMWAYGSSRSLGLGGDNGSVSAMSRYLNNTIQNTQGMWKLCWH